MRNLVSSNGYSPTFLYNSTDLEEIYCICRKPPCLVPCLLLEHIFQWRTSFNDTLSKINPLLAGHKLSFTFMIIGSHGNRRNTVLVHTLTFISRYVWHQKQDLHSNLISFTRRDVIIALQGNYKDNR